MTRKVESCLRYYVITSPLKSTMNGLTRYGKLVDASRTAVEISKYAPGIQIHVIEMPAGRVVKLCQDGHEYLLMQTTLTNEEDLELDANYAANLGKMWWMNFEKEATQIAILRSKMSPTESQRQSLSILQANLNSYLETLQSVMPKQSYELCVWRHIDSAQNRNRGCDLPQDYRHYDKTSINRRIRSGYTETGYIAYQQGWTLTSSDAEATMHS